MFYRKIGRMHSFRLNRLDHMSKFGKECKPMAFHYVSIAEKEIIDCYRLTKNINHHDHSLVKKYSRIIHFSVGRNPNAYLCRAKSTDEARELAQIFLNTLAVITEKSLFTK